MQHSIFLGPWDTALLAAPFLVMLAAWMLGLDELLAAPRRKRRGHDFSQVSRNGHSMFTDPDGRPWKHASEQPSRGPLEQRAGGKVKD